MESAAARGICRREGVGKLKALEVRTLWLQQVVKAKTLTLKTVKSEDNCADLGTKTLAAGTLSLLRGLKGLVDKSAMDMMFPVRSASCNNFIWRISQAQRIQRCWCWNEALDEIARNDQIMSGV